VKPDEPKEEAVAAKMSDRPEVQADDAKVADAKVADAKVEDAKVERRHEKKAALPKEKERSAPDTAATDAAKPRRVSEPGSEEPAGGDSDKDKD
jgi:hypothetical protein